MYRCRLSLVEFDKLEILLHSQIDNPKKKSNVF